MPEGRVDPADFLALARRIGEIALGGRTKEYFDAGYRPTVKRSQTDEQAMGHLHPSLRPVSRRGADRYVPQARRIPEWMARQNLLPERTRRPGTHRGRGYATLAIDPASAVAPDLPPFDPPLKTVEDAQAEWARSTSAWSLEGLQPGDLLICACVRADAFERSS